MYCLKYQQKLPISMETAWQYFSSPKNLKDITPKFLDFSITNELFNDKMYEGQIIIYKLRPLLNFPIEWVTEITHVEKPYYFVDEMRCGPYKIWHHEHWFKEIENGVEVTDIVHYKMPFGFIGKMIHSLKVKKDLKKIFAYRRQVLNDLFGDYK